jgi:RimJ/RimL family protein N-acetyltransferase
MDHDITGSWGRIILSPLLRSDIEPLRFLRNRESKWFFKNEQIDSISQAKWYEHYLQQTDDFMFRISLKNNIGIFIGAVGIYHIDSNTRFGEFGRLLIDHTIVTEKGLGVDATICACKIGFEYFNLQTIKLEVLDTNKRAIKTYERSGFIFKDRRETVLVMYIEKSLLQDIKR